MGKIMNLPATNQATQIAVSDPMISMIERAARDPSIDINKLERLIVLQEKAQERAAEQAFNSAMSDAQGEMTSVAVDSNNPQTKSRYASYFALDKALRPIYSKHGFALSFGTGEIPQESYVRVLCYASHRGGFTRTYHIDMPADGKGAKGGDVMTKTHATGSAMSYGQRYLLKMIFNISVGSDDDGNAASPAQRSRVPSPSDAPAKATAAPEVPQAPHAIAGGKGAAGWAKLYVDAILTSDSSDVVDQWEKANAHNLEKVAQSDPQLYKDVRGETQRHLNFLHKTAPKAKEDPISSGVPKPNAMPNIDDDPAAWMAWAVAKVAATNAGDDMDALFESFDPFYMDLSKENRESLLGARKAREKEMEP
jgi:hypothetical protein